MENSTILAQLKALRGEIDALLTSIPDRLDAFDGLKLRLGNCKYERDGSFTFKLEGTLPGGKTKEATDYETLAKILALPTHTWDTGASGKTVSTRLPGKTLPPLGAMMSIKGVRVKIVGARLRAKFNVTVERLDGSRTCYKDSDIARLWAQQSKEAA